MPDVVAVVATDSPLLTPCFPPCFPPCSCSVDPRPAASLPRSCTTSWRPRSTRSSACRRATPSTAAQTIALRSQSFPAAPCGTSRLSSQLPALLLTLPPPPPLSVSSTRPSRILARGPTRLCLPSSSASPPKSAPATGFTSTATAGTSLSSPPAPVSSLTAPSRPRSHGRTGTVVVNLLSVLLGISAAEAMRLMQEVRTAAATRSRPCRRRSPEPTPQSHAVVNCGSCALSRGALEDEKQEMQTQKLEPAMGRMHKIHAQ